MLKKRFNKFDAIAISMVATMADLEAKDSSKAQFELKSLRNNDWVDSDLSVNFAAENLDYEVDLEINKKVSLWKGDITTLEVDAIVNAANRAMRGGGGIDGRIHQVAGPTLLEECIELNGCPTGQTKVTRGHNLPCKYILHTVGPRVTSERHPLPHTNLTGCYATILDLARQHKIRSVAICCISTGIFGYPLDMATHVALSTVRNWLAIPENKDAIDRIIFCVYNPPDLDIYERLLQVYFPIGEQDLGLTLTLPSVKRSSPSVTAFAEPINDAEGLINAIKAARTPKNAGDDSSSPAPEMDLGGLAELLATLDKAASKKFFETTLPTIIEYASRRKELLGNTELDLLAQLYAHENLLSGAQIACLLSCAFLTIMPIQKLHVQAFTKLSFEGLWKSFAPVASSSAAATESSSPGEKPKKSKKSKSKEVDVEAIKANAVARFQAILHYFENIEDDDKPRFFSRCQGQPPRDAIDWQRLRNKPIPVHAVDAPLSSAAEPQVILLPVNIHFASSWFEHTARISQSDAFVWSNPELLTLALFASTLLTTEVLHSRQVQAGLPLTRMPNAQLEVGKPAKNKTHVHHVVFVPQAEVTLPRHAASRFYVQTQLNTFIGALKTIKGPLKIAVSDWTIDGPRADLDHSVSNLHLALALTTFELKLLMGDDAAKMNKKDPERPLKCPELFMYSSGTVPAELSALLTTLEAQEVQYQILLAAASGVVVLGDALNPAQGSLLLQLKHRFSSWKKEYKTYVKVQEKERKEREKEEYKAHLERERAREAARKAAHKERIEREREQMKKAKEASKAEAKARKDEMSSSEEMSEEQSQSDSSVMSSNSIEVPSPRNH